MTYRQERIRDGHRRDGFFELPTAAIARRILLFGGLLASIATLVAATGADAGRWRWYSQPAGCDDKPTRDPNDPSKDKRNWTDPVGMVFLGQHGQEWFVDHEVQERLRTTYGGNWAHGSPGGQFLYRHDTGSCIEMTQSQASSGAGSRWHMRVGHVLWEPVGAKFVYWSLGTPHYDKQPLTGGHCNPANSESLQSPNGQTFSGGSFNAARRVFKQGLRNGGPKGFIEIRGSTPGFTKKRDDACGGKKVSSNGHVVWIRVGGIPPGTSSTGPYAP